MVKLTGLKIAERQPAKKGNIIVFSQPDAVIGREAQQSIFDRK